MISRLTYLTGWKEASLKIENVYEIFQKSYIVEVEVGGKTRGRSWGHVIIWVMRLCLVLFVTPAWWHWRQPGLLTDALFS